MLFRSTVSRVNPAVTLVIMGGSLDVDSSDRVRKLLNDLVNSGTRHLVINCKDIATVDSSGLSHLTQAAARLAGVGGGVHLVRVSPALTRILDITSSASKFRIHPDEAEAFKAAGL